MFRKAKIKMLEKKLNKLKSNPASNEEVIKFLAVNLFKEIEKSYLINFDIGMKHLNLFMFENHKDEIEIFNSSANISIIAKTKK